MILTYVLKDDIKHEREMEVESFEEATQVLSTHVIPHMIDWAELTDDDGVVVAATEELI